jgi:hypothetical protein
VSLNGRERGASSVSQNRREIKRVEYLGIRRQRDRIDLPRSRQDTEPSIQQRHQLHNGSSTMPSDGRDLHHPRVIIGRTHRSTPRVDTVARSSSVEHALHRVILTLTGTRFVTSSNERDACHLPVESFRSGKRRLDNAVIMKARRLTKRSFRTTQGFDSS